MSYRDDDDLMADYCPHCGQYTGGDSVCPNCGKTIFDDTGLEEHDENEDEGGEDRGRDPDEDIGDDDD